MLCSSCTDRKLTTCNWLQFNILSVWNGQFSTVIILVHANNLAPLVLWFWIPLGGRWFSLRTLVSSTNKTDRQDIAEMLLKVALNTITVPQNNFEHYDFWWLLNMKVLIEIYQVLTVLVWFRSTIFNDPRTSPPSSTTPEPPLSPQLLCEYTSFNPCYVTGGCHNSFTSHLEFIESILKKPTTIYSFENPQPGLGQAQKCGGVRLNNVIPTLPQSIIGSSMVTHIILFTNNNFPTVT